jgi:hypothetical protein
MTITHPHQRAAGLRRLTRRLLLILAAASLIGASLAAQKTESDLAADLSAPRPSHAGTCMLRCPLHRPSHHDLANGWPQPFLPLGLLALSAGSLLGATRITQPRRPAQCPPASCRRGVADGNHRPARPIVDRPPDRPHPTRRHIFTTEGVHMSPAHPAIIPDTPIRQRTSTVALPHWALALQLLIIVVALSIALATVLMASSPQSPTRPQRPSIGSTHHHHHHHHPTSHPRFQFI